MKKVKHTEKGSVVILVLILAVLVGLIAASISLRIKGSLEVQKGRVLRNQYIELTESIGYQLEDPLICPTLIGGQPMLPTTDRLNSINTSFGTLSSSQVIRPGWSSKDGGVTIGSLPILNLTYIKDVYMANDGATYQVYRGDVHLNTSNVRINVTGPGGRSDLLITLLFMVQNNVIRGCFGETSQGGQCIAMGGAYDWRNQTVGYAYPQNRCHPQKICRYTSDGVFSATEAVANSTCKSPFKPTSVGTFMTTGQGRWFCQWCNSYYHD